MYPAGLRCAYMGTVLLERNKSILSCIGLLSGNRKWTPLWTQQQQLKNVRKNEGKRDLPAATALSFCTVSFFCYHGGRCFFIFK